LFLTLDDGFGCSDLTFFEDSQQGYAHIIKGNSLIVAKGVIRRTGARGISIRASAAWSLDELYQSWLGEQRGTCVSSIGPSASKVPKYYESMVRGVNPSNQS
jgi:DNA polymerase III, alpha subunit